jgi:ubiquinone biosynthesis protein
VPAVPADAMKPVLEAELGGAVDTVFSDFDWEPLAAGSIGQTYTGRLRTGEAVVVKVQRPGIKDDMERDLAALALVAEVAQRRTAIGQGMRTSDVLEQFAASLREELDFMHEADAMIEMASRLGPGANVRIPKVCHAYCTHRLLVQERFDGWTVADLDTIEDAGFDREALGVQLLRSTMQQVLGVGYFHADPHPGNIFVFRDGTLGLIDFGAVGRLDPIQQAAVVDILAALVRRDISLLRDGIERVADLTESVSPDRLERALARLVALHVRPNGTVDANVLPDLVALLTTFGVRLPGEIVVLSRALVTLDGTLRVLAPGLSLVAATTDIAMSGDAPVALAPDKLLHDEIIAALPQLRRLPDRIDRILTLTGRGDLRIRHVMDEDGRRTVRTLANRALLSLVGAAFLLAATMLLVARDAGPAIATHTGLFEVFGYGGLLIGTVLVLRVVAAVTRDGTT